MGKKLIDSKTVEKLAMLAVAKVGPGDNIAEITKKVISDYLGAKAALKKYNDTVLSPKAALKLLGDKRQEQKSKTKIRTRKNAAGE